jgi:predicted lipoprotein with Yx(FWY)xxD motif
MARRSPVIPVLCLATALGFVGASVALRPAPPPRQPASISTAPATSAPPGTATEPPPTEPPPTEPPPGTGDPAETEVHLDVLETRLGTVVTGPGGATVYRSDADSAKPSRSTCLGDCAATFPPVTIAAQARVTVAGISPALVGAIRRPDGRAQLTLAGFPLYTYAGDENPGDTKGDGVNDIWHAIGPAGRPATNG